MLKQITRLFILFFICFMAEVLPVKAESSPSLKGVWLKSAWHLPTTKKFKDIYTDRGANGFELSLTKKRLGGRLERVLSIGYFPFSGTNETTRYNRYKLNLIPISAGLHYNFSSHEDQPFVPYLGAGVTVVPYVENLKGIINGKETEPTNLNLVGGLYGSLGMKILLDFFDFNSAKRIEKELGLKNFYAVLDATYSELSINGTQLEEASSLSGVKLSVGLLIEF